MWIKTTNVTGIATFYHIEEIVRIVAPSGSIGQMAVTMSSTNTFSGLSIADWNAGDLLNDDWSVAGPNPMQV